MKQITLLAVSLLTGGASLFAADPQLLNMAPPDAQMFAGINVEQAKTSQFGQFLLANIPVNADFQEFITSTGFDLRGDLREVLIVTSGAPGAAAPANQAASHHAMPTSGLLLAKGTFNVSKILSAAAKDGKATISTYSGVPLITISGGDHSEALGLIDGMTAVAGESNAVKGALDRRAGNNVIPPGVMVRINQLSATEDIWSVSTANFGALQLPGTGGDNSGSAVLAGIQQASGGIKFGTQVQLDAQAVTGNSQDATSLSDVVKLLAQMVQMHTSAGGAPGQVTDLLKSLVVTTEANIVKVTLTLPEDQLEALFKMAEEHHKGDAQKI